ncbi:Ca2+-binding RTX toxin-like protein [Rhizobium sp. SG_E_25_P2]|uniref:calcium-binding protein n=1 Tax=Rhizobium sp. SG_E_25_P2 TaxID=2879942 RepID=UPI002472EF55|nr:calcium-binding protein [Rhizobium sp. SG_E_25_P2]MDH6269481.1 Ca2+-binding RTX toxin-like protein [Rhizobium sp. SG_E_25_P2]
MRLIFTNTSGAGVQAALTAGEDFYLAADVYFGSTNTYAITAADSNHRFDIYGSVVSENGVNLGDAGTDTNNRIFIHAGAMIRTPDDNSSWCVNLDSSSSKITNEGLIEGYYGVVFGANSADTTSRLVNSGEIIGADTFYGTIVRDSGASETVIVDNSGTIRGVNAYNAVLGAGIDIINNSGTIVGDILLYALDDKYNGKKGFIDGIVDGGDGADILNGGVKLDHFLGGAGADTLYGYLGRDKLGGGADADTFLYKSVTESTGKTADTILDFTKADNDLINIHAIDANTTAKNNQDFTFIANSAFSGDAGELRSFVSGGNTTVQADINGDGKADFVLKLTGAISLAGSDFLL